MLIKQFAYYFGLSYWGIIYLKNLDTMPGFFFVFVLRSAIFPSFFLDADLYWFSLTMLASISHTVHRISSLFENIAVLMVFGLNGFGFTDVPFAHELF